MIYNFKNCSSIWMDFMIRVNNFWINTPKTLVEEVKQIFIFKIDFLSPESTFSTEPSISYLGLMLASFLYAAVCFDLSIWFSMLSLLAKGVIVVQELPEGLLPAAERIPPIWISLPSYRVIMIKQFSIFV